MLSAWHRQAADADTRKTGGRRILITKNPKRAMSASAGPEAIAPMQISGGAMYQRQAAVGRDGKSSEKEPKRTKSLKLLARNCGYLRVLAHISGFGIKNGAGPSGQTMATRVMGRGGYSVNNVSGNAGNSA